jgi:hypothetical protein
VNKQKYLFTEETNEIPEKGHRGGQLKIKNVKLKIGEEEKGKNSGSRRL